MRSIVASRAYVGCVAATMMCLAGTRADAQHDAAIVRTVRTAETLQLDGRLREDAWTRAPLIDRFTQKDPDEGSPPSELTEVRLLYDDGALYVGARLHDSVPAQIARRLSPRDELPDADYIAVYLDPRHDHTTGVGFIVTAAGVQRDVVISNDTVETASWDAVWMSAVSVDEAGWSVEIRIPFSQLRFNSSDPQVWGINVVRHLRRANETVWLQLVPKDESGLASRMAHMTGLEGVGARRQIEIVPYTAVRQEFVQPDRAGDPLNDGARAFASVGIDVKAPLPAGLTLDATVNPDFGQAEVDPAVVNLTAFETFFEEKRRFFTEGAEIFNNFGTGGSNTFFGFNTSDPSIFYSRRIGRAPQRSPDGDFIDSPRASSFLGAAKVTGKTADGWSIGLIEAMTGRETARVVNGPALTRTPVEPLTNYFVARLQRDFARGGAGILATSVQRRLETPDLRELLTGRAVVIGGDAHVFFDKAHDWVVTGKFSGSRVSGSAGAIEKLQRAAQRYFQRPAAPRIHLDPSRTSLSGYAGRINLNRNGGVWRVNAAFWGVSPGFESNDLGFHTNSDRFGGHAVLLWGKQHPDRWTRSRGAWIARAATWNYDRDVLNNIWFGCAHAVFLNYSRVNACVLRGYRSLDDGLTRGGAIAVNPKGRGVNVGFATDTRKWLSLDGHGGKDWDEAGNWGSDNGVTLNVKPISSLTVSAGPQFVVSRNRAQYVDTFDDRAVFATIDQRQLSMTSRVNWTMNPHASVQVYIQPLLARAGYRGFKELGAPRTYEFAVFEPGAFLSFDGVAGRYTIDPDATGSAAPFSFDDPDFNLKSLRVNAVFRWEFAPGSVLYVAWTEERKDENDPKIFSFQRDVKKVWTAPADDVVLVKVVYWLGR